MANYNITFVIFTYNEANRIGRVIENFKGYGKILLADNNSTDGTQEIAKAHGCEVYLRQKEYVFVENQELVDELYKHITTDWVYWGFADEMLEEKTLLQLQTITASGKYDIISIDRKNYFYGTYANNIYNSYTFKLFKKHAIDFTNNIIHGMGKPAVAADRVYKMPDQYFIHHFISNTASSYLNVINRYTDSELESVYEPHTSIWYLLIIVARQAIKEFLFKRGYRSGFKGLALIELTLIYQLVKNMKHYEKAESLTTPTIEAKNNIYRDQILKQNLK